MAHTYYSPRIDDIRLIDEDDNEGGHKSARDDVSIQAFYNSMQTKLCPNSHDMIDPKQDTSILITHDSPPTSFLPGIRLSSAKSPVRLDLADSLQILKVKHRYPIGLLEALNWKACFA